MQIKQAHSGIIQLLLMMLLLFPTDRTQVQANPIILGVRRELMVDDYLIDSMDGELSLKMHSPTPQEVVVVHDEPWEGCGSGYHSIFQDGDIYRMYYKAWQISAVAPRPSGDKRLFICYAESKDGIRWEKPSLGLHEFDGSKDNNILMVEIAGSGLHDFSVFKDTNPNVPPDEKYKAVGLAGSSQRGLYGLKSADGIHWNTYNGGKPIMTGHPFDTQNTAFWDPSIGEYRAYVREFYPATLGSPRRRGIMTSQSKDFVHWSERKWIDFGDAPKEQLYTNQIKPYSRAPHLYIGFPARYVERMPGSSSEQLPRWQARQQRAETIERYGFAVTDALLATSRDGLHFNKWGEAFIRPGLRENNWSYGDNYVAWHAIETTSAAPGSPPELSIYATEDYFTGHEVGLRRYTLRLDGFVSLHASLAGGSMVTKPVQFDGDTLSINYATSAAGGICIELQDAEGMAIPGYELKNCDEIFGDQHQRSVTWQGDGDLSSLKGKPVRLKIHLSDADLFSFQFSHKDSMGSEASVQCGPPSAISDGETLSTLLDSSEPMTWVITGDSITQGAAHTHGSRSYAEHFAERVRWEMRRTRDVVVNTGISGNRTEDLLDDYDWRVARLAPNVVSLMIGTNDAVAGEKGLPTYRANVLKLIERIRQDGAIPVLQTPNPVDPEQLSRRAALPEYVKVMREVAKEANVLLVDHYAYWEEQCPTRESMLPWLADPIHPNAKGHLMFAQEMFRVLEVFDKTAATCQPLPAEAEILKVQEVEATEAEEVDAALLLPPSEGNPRNSEGDFIKLQDGRLLFVYTHFYGGGDDHSAARLAARYSEDGGQTWNDEDVTVVDNEGGMNVMSVSLQRLADGRIALFYLLKNSTTNTRPVMRISTDEAKTWSEPVTIIPEVQNGYYVLNNDRVIQTNGGRLIVPVAQHNGYQMKEHGEWTSNGLISCYLSDDGGETWRRSAESFYVANPAGQRIASQEPGVVELTDGRILMFIRTSGGVQYFSYSSDGGETWTDAEPSSLRSPVSPASIERIPKTGDLLAVWNNNYDTRHRGGGKRTPLNAAISRDEGTTWSESRVLFDDPEGWYCYTAIHFEGDYVLLGHCAGGKGQQGWGLSVTQLTRFPITRLYE